MQQHFNINHNSKQEKQTQRHIARSNTTRKTLHTHITQQQNTHRQQQRKQRSAQHTNTNNYKHNIEINNIHIDKHKTQMKHQQNYSWTAIT